MEKQKSINTNNTDDNMLKQILDEIKILSTSRNDNSDENRTRVIGEYRPPAKDLLTYGEFYGDIVYSRTPLDKDLRFPQDCKEDMMVLIRKSRPEKVMRILGNKDEVLCPICLRKIDAEKEQYNYCPNCGQKLDWEY